MGFKVHIGWVLIFLFTAFEGKATHLMGSDLTYTCSNDTVTFKLKVYRDCNGVALTGTQVLNIRGGAVNTNLNLSFISKRDITPVCESKISKCMPGGNVTYGFEEHTFTGKFFFGVAPYNAICAWRVSWTNAARNNTITTGQAGQNYYTYTVFDRCLAPCNNAPVFSDAPVSVICQGYPQYINMSAIDTLDGGGDSLSYHLDTAWQALNVMCSYTTPFSPKSPISSFVTVKIDSISGTLNLIPSVQNQQAVLVVAVKEWRKVAGIYRLISVIRRDIQVLVDYCGTNSPPILPTIATQTVCPGSQICFTISPNDANANDSVSLRWSSNISGGTFTTAYTKPGKPYVQEGTFCWTPTNAQIKTTPYYFAVLARDNSCDFSLYSTRTYYVRVKEQAIAAISPVGPVSIILGDSVLLTATAPAAGYTYQWFKNGGVISGITSNTYYAKQNGVYRVVINTTDNCPDTSNAVTVDYVTSISSYPYYESFEGSTSNGWTTSGTNNSWQWGSPSAAAKPNIGTSVANGSKAWYTNLTGNYANSQLSYLTSPVFDMSTAFGATNPVLSFNFIRRLPVAGSDLLWVEYKDGASWIKLGVSGSGTNWYNAASTQSWDGQRTKWHVASYVIPLNSITNKSAVQIRFVFSTNASVTNEGVGIDDIHIHSNEPIWTAATSITNQKQRSTGTNTWINFTSGGGRIISIKDNGFYLDTVTVNCYRNTGAVRSVNAGGLQYYLDRNWVIRTKNAPSVPITVRLYLTDAEFQALDLVDPVINDIKRMGITKYSGANQDNLLANNTTIGAATFISPDNITSVMPYQNGYIVEFNVSSFSEFWVNGGTAGMNQPLPVEFISFDAKRLGDNAFLTWTTAWESNNELYEIERSNSSLANFTKTGEVPGKGFASTISSYEFTDVNVPFSGPVYYRLKQVDKDGAFRYSTVRVVDFGSMLPEVTLVPNPFSKNLNLNMWMPVAQPAIIQLTDMNGTVVKWMNIKLNEGENKLEVVSENRILPSGFYVLTIQTSQGLYRYKVIRN